MAASEKTQWKLSQTDSITENNAASKEIYEFDKHKEKGDYHKWIVATMSFLIYIVSGGVSNIGGLIIPELLVSFPQNGKATVSLIISLVNGMTFFSGKYRYT